MASNPRELANQLNESPFREGRKFRLNGEDGKNYKIDKVIGNSVYYVDDANGHHVYDKRKYQPNTFLWEDEEIRYPSGTSKEYTDRVNADYEKVIPFLKENGYDVDAFTNDTVDNKFSSNIEEHLRKLFEGSNADEELQGLYKQSKYDEGNALWDKKYKPLFDALMRAEDKYYNDWYIKNAPNGYPKD